MLRDEGLSRVHHSVITCAVGSLQRGLLDRCRHTKPTGHSGASHAADAYRVPRRGQDSKPQSLSTTRGLRVQGTQGQPTRLRLQISAPSAPSWPWHAPKGRLAPAMAAPKVRSVAAASTHGLGRRRIERSIDRGDVPKYRVVCLCRDESATRQSGLCERHSMHQTSVHAQAAPPAPSRLLQQLSASVDRRLVLLSDCMRVLRAQMAGLVVGTEQSAALTIIDPLPTRHKA